MQWVIFMPRITPRMSLTAGGRLGEVVALKHVICMSALLGPYYSRALEVLHSQVTCASLSIGTDVVSALEDKSKAVCIVCSW